MKKILITGATGLVAGAVMREQLRLRKNHGVSQLDFSLVGCINVSSVGG